MMPAHGDCPIQGYGVRLRQLTDYLHPDLWNSPKNCPGKKKGQFDDRPNYMITYKNNANPLTWTRNRDLRIN